MKTLMSLILLSASPLVFAACTQTPTKSTVISTAENNDVAVRATVQTVYDGFAAGDMDLTTSAMANDIIWNEAQGNPYADKNPYIGPDAILAGLFSRVGSEWDYFAAETHEFIIDGGRVVVIGRYNAKHATSGVVMDAPFAHVWTVNEGEITAFQQYTDTAAHVEAMGG